MIQLKYISNPDVKSESRPKSVGINNKIIWQKEAPHLVRDLDPDVLIRPRSDWQSRN